MIRIGKSTARELKGANSKETHRKYETCLGIKYRMKDWNKGIYGRNEGQSCIMGYFEWQFKELGFYPEDRGELSMGLSRGVSSWGSGGGRGREALEPLSPLRGYCASSGTRC